MSVDKNCAGVVVRSDIRSDDAKAMAETAELQKGPHITLIPNYTTDRERDVYWSTGKNQEFAGHGSREGQIIPPLPFASLQDDVAVALAGATQRFELQPAEPLPGAVSAALFCLRARR
jgi:hypothetical protein